MAQITPLDISAYLAEAQARYQSWEAEQFNRGYCDGSAEQPCYQPECIPYLKGYIEGQRSRIHELTYPMPTEPEQDESEPVWMTAEAIAAFDDCPF
jgi:hypothetical protein